MANIQFGQKENPTKITATQLHKYEPLYFCNYQRLRFVMAGLTRERVSGVTRLFGVFFPNVNQLRIAT